MKATVNLDDQLYRHVKVTAAQRGVTVTSIFDAALRRYLADLDRPSAIAVEFSFPTVDGQGGLMPGVDLADGAELQRLSDLDTPPGRLR